MTRMIHHWHVGGLLALGMVLLAAGCGKREAPPAPSRSAAESAPAASPAPPVPEPAKVTNAPTKGIGVEGLRAAETLGSNRHALVIGINDYADAKIPKLKFAEADARLLYQTLTDPQIGGFSTDHAKLLLGSQASSREIKKQLSALRGVGADDLVVIYFSGHGAKQRGETCWVTQDAELDYLADTALTSDQLKKYLDDIPSRRLVTFIDACYAADTVLNQKAIVDFASVAAAFTGAGRVTIASAGGGQEAIEDQSLRQGIFTYYLARGLRGGADENADGVITLEETWRYLTRTVEKEARKRQGVQAPTRHAQAETQTDRYLLAVNAERLAAVKQEKAAGQQQVRARVDALKKLFAEDRITAEQLKEGRRVLEAAEDSLDESDRQRRRIYTDLADGALKPDYLQAALDKVESPAQREARLAREASERQARADAAAREKAEREKAQKVAELMARARANDTREGRSQALAALSEALGLDPSHAEARALREKIQRSMAELPRRGKSFSNSLGMRFVPAGTDGVLFCVWETRVKDFEVFADASRHRAEGGMFSLVSKAREGTDGKSGADYWQQRGHTWRDPGFAQTPEHPVCGVNWEDAKAFCQWLTDKERREGKIGSEDEYRLPTDEEWSRAVGTGKYPWGEAWPPPRGVGNYAGSEACDENWPSVFPTIQGFEDGFARTAPVGSFRPNSYGLYDMGGNVWEWCEDWYRKEMNSDEARKAFPGLNEDRGGNELKVVRGGSWCGDVPVNLASSYRCLGHPAVRSDYYGFRCVLAVGSSR